MTTDRASDDRADRLEALRRRPRRRHAATGGRILAGSASAVVALGLMGAMAHAAKPTAVASTATTAHATAAPSVIVIHRPAGTAVAAPAAPQIVPTTAAPVTTTRAS